MYGSQARSVPVQETDGAGSFAEPAALSGVDTDTGMAAGFLANSGDGHHLRNDSASVASYLVVGDRVGGDVCHYSDVDLHGVVSSDGQSITFSHKGGHSYEEKD